jgi:hypothetical protein
MSISKKVPMIKRVLFARVGYMKYYAGRQEGDERPRSGGSYNVDHVGHELYNFKSAYGFLYGHFTPYTPRGENKRASLNLRRIDPTAEYSDSLDDVLIVFFSRSDAKGQVIVGWYNNATLFREYQKPTKKMLREDYRFIARAKSEDTVLLPERCRVHAIPTGAGASGRANVVYPRNNDGSTRDFNSGPSYWIGRAIAFIESYDGPNLLSDRLANIEDQVATVVENEESARSGQGFSITAEIRKKIEDHAVKRATAYYQRKRYKVNLVKGGKPYDLECRKGKKVLRVEVKGTQTDGESIILTANEVANARRNPTALFVLHSIKCEKKGKSAVPSGGKKHVLDPWHIETHGKLRPLLYMYDIRTDKKSV